MPKPHHATHTDPDTAIWAIEGDFSHVIYSPKGEIEGFLITTDGTPTQFTIDPHDLAAAALIGPLKPGQALNVEGTEASPSPKGEGEHFVYRLMRVAAVDGREPVSLQGLATTSGRVVRFNHARHGQANGVVLDNGDFVHTKPQGLAHLGLHIGDHVDAQGPAQPLCDGLGRVIEAQRVNQKAVQLES